MVVDVLFYFIGGYLLYGSMFAAVGAAVDYQTDTQQFMLPINNSPLILALGIGQSIIGNPFRWTLGGWVSYYTFLPFGQVVNALLRFWV